MKKRLLKNVTGVALLSRIIIILLQFLFNMLIPDHQSDGFVSPAVNISKNIYDHFVSLLFGGLIRWDAQYFLHIAMYGYVYENTLAFFPGFPLCIRLVSIPLSMFHSSLNVFSIYILSSVIINVVAFVFAARSLFNLTYKILKDEKLAYYAATLFAINPASIFFTAPYSEALFAFFTFQAMLNENTFFSCTFVALSSSVRSNGVVNLGFPIYRTLKKLAHQPLNSNSVFSFIYEVSFIVLGSLSVFIAYQIYSYSSFCTLYPFRFDREVLMLAQEKSYLLRGQNISEMCQTFLPYFYVQKHYWDVGFLHYFRFKQLPNFMLAFPIIYFSAFESLKYFRKNFRLVCTLGLENTSSVDTHIKMFPYCVHMILLLIICLFFVHIQVTTRLLCSCSPLVYWYAATLLKIPGRPKHCISLFGFSFTICSIKLYCLSYFIIGTALFSNFYPWT